MLTKYILWLVLTANAFFRARAQAWSEPFMTLTPEAVNLGITYNITGSSSFRVQIPEYSRTSNNFELGFFNFEGTLFTSLVQCPSALSKRGITLLKYGNFIDGSKTSSVFSHLKQLEKEGKTNRGWFIPLGFSK